MRVTYPQYWQLKGSTLSPIRNDINIDASATGLANRKFVGPNGDFKTLKAGVDWFNENATICTEFILDSGFHVIDETITISSSHSSSCMLAIRGLGLNSTRMIAGLGLQGGPMFRAETACEFNRLRADGSTLPAYGEVAGENFLTLFGAGGVFVKIQEVAASTFYHGILDGAGTELIVYNFLFDAMTKGVEINHSSPVVAVSDIEAGNMLGCDIGVDFVAAPSDSFILRNIIFTQENPTDIAVRYNGATYSYGDYAEIMGCSSNNVGTFISGFDFTRADGRDANIHILNNVGISDQDARAKVNVINGTRTTTVTLSGTYYKVDLLATNFSVSKMAVDNNKMTYLPNAKASALITIAGNVQVDGTNRNVDIGLRKNGAGDILGAFTVRTSTANQPVAFAIVAHIEEVNKDDYFELYLTSSANGDVVTVQDFGWYFEER